MVTWVNFWGWSRDCCKINMGGMCFREFVLESCKDVCTYECIYICICQHVNIHMHMYMYIYLISSPFVPRHMGHLEKIAAKMKYIGNGSLTPIQTMAFLTFGSIDYFHILAFRFASHEDCCNHDSCYMLVTNRLILNNKYSIQ